VIRDWLLRSWNLRPAVPALSQSGSCRTFKFSSCPLTWRPANPLMASA
jgi:hypothetical protein